MNLIEQESKKRCIDSKQKFGSSVLSKAGSIGRPQWKKKGLPPIMGLPSTYRVAKLTKPKPKKRKRKKRKYMVVYK